MAHHVKVDKREIEALKKRLEQFGRQDQIEQFITSCAKNLAARLLAKVIKRTPVGQYDTPVYFKDGEAVTFTPHTGKMGGTLRRGWTAKTEAEAESGSAAGAAEYTQSLTIQHEGSDYVIEIINPVHYASYVEFGHRTANHKGWVEGRFMLTISEQELEAATPAILANKLEKYLEGCFK